MKNHLIKNPALRMAPPAPRDGSPSPAGLGLPGAGSGPPKKGVPSAVSMALAVLFWLAVWQVACLIVGKAILLPSPLAVGKSLVEMLPTPAFWQAVGTSLWRIGLGFVLGLVVGMGLAMLSAAAAFVETLLRPLMLLVRSTPVASFIILALLWVNSRALSTFISFLMVLPVLYSTTLLGIRSADTGLLEMARVFRVGGWRRLRAVYVPAMLPALLNACELALGMSWKSGVAAEVIGLPQGTIGERLYQAKIWLQTPQLFAWTAVIILLSAVFGKVVLVALKAGGKRLAYSSVRVDTVAGEGNEAAGVAPIPQTPGPTIALSHLCKSFGAQPVLVDFSASLPGGAAAALMGPSGSGKTTLARVIIGLEKQDAGVVAFNGVPVPPGIPESRPGLACVFQEDRLCESLSAAQNVALVLSKAQWPAVAGALQALGLTGELAQKPVADLSGGERRRAALARAVLAPSAVLVLDEAFKGLDETARQQACAYVLQNAGGRTLLVVTHDEEEAAALGAQVVRLQGGQNTAPGVI